MTETHFQIRRRAYGPYLGIYTAPDAEAAYDVMLRDAGYGTRADAVDAQEGRDERADFAVEEYPLSAQQQVWVDEHKDAAFDDEESYPNGMATLWQHDNNGNLYFAEEGWDANGSAKYLALVNLDDGHAH